MTSVYEYYYYRKGKCYFRNADGKVAIKLEINGKGTKELLGLQKYGKKVILDGHN